MNQSPTDLTRVTARTIALAVAMLAILPLTSCNPSAVDGKHARGEEPTVFNPSTMAHGGGDRQPPIRGGEFRGVKHGATFADLKHRFGENLRKGVERNGEGDFDYFGLYEGGSEIMRFFLSESGKVERATTRNPAYKTDKGIGVGSTLADLRAAYPAIEITGSEIEGWTFAASTAEPGVAFFIGSHFWHYQLSAREIASIPPATKVKSISILRP